MGQWFVRHMVVMCGLGVAFAPLANAEPAKTAVDGKAFEKAVTSGVEYLKNKGQAADGSFSAQAGPGVTALVLTGILRSGRSPDEPWIQKGLKYLEAQMQEDGGVSKADAFYRNYDTCLTLLCFSEANKDKRYDAQIKKMDAYLKGNQWDESEGKDKSDLFYGGAGYGRSKRPDLSNTHFMVEALRASGNGADSEAIQRALVFISRCQNLETEHNTTAFAAKVTDGGFYYTPAGGGSSQAGTTADGGLRSYGSMTYAGLKSMIFAGLKADDPRVKAATTWIKKNYDLKNNPGMKDSGLFYYYHTFAKAIAAMNTDTFEDEKGVKHDWRNEMVQELVSRQKADGSWINDNNKWLEGDPNLVTGYALLTLSYCKPETK